LGKLRQHGRQVDDQLAKQVQPDRANVLHGLVRFRAGAGFLGDFPRFAIIDELVGAVGHGHDEPHRLSELAVLVGLGDFLAVLPGPLEQARVVGIFGGKPGSLGKSAVRLAMFTTLPTRSEFTLPMKSSKFRSMSSTAADSFEA